jgi:hypothetical protein
VSPSEFPANKKGDFPYTTYSKSGSDSISLIVFGRILIKSSPEQAPPASEGADKASKKKEKFSIKSTDKLKTDNALY